MKKETNSSHNVCSLFKLPSLRSHLSKHYFRWKICNLGSKTPRFSLLLIYSLQYTVSLFSKQKPNSRQIQT